MEHPTIHNQAHHKNQGSDNIPRLRFPEFKGEWERKKLGEVAEISSGGTPSRTNPNYWSGNIPWVSTTLIDFNFINKTDEYITEEGLKNSSAKLFPKGTLLMAMYGQGKTRGKIAILGIEASTNQACGAITTNNEVLDSLFAFQNLAKRYDEIRDLSNQGGQENLSGGIIKGIKISFPSLPEQTRIASFFTILDRKISELKQKKNLLEQYKKGVMQKCLNYDFSDLSDEYDLKNKTNKKSQQSQESNKSQFRQLRFKDENGKDFPIWEKRKLRDLVDFRNGKAHEQDISENGKYIVVNSKFISRDGVVKKYSDTQICPLELGEIVMVMSDVPNGKALAKCFLIDANNKYTLNQRICALKGKNTDTKFLIYILNRNKYYLMFDSGVGQTNLTRDEVLDCPLIVPSSLKEQTKIANFLSAIDEKINRTENQIKQTQQYKKGLLQNMFC